MKMNRSAVHAQQKSNELDAPLRGLRNNLRSKKLLFFNPSLHMYVWNVVFSLAHV